MTVLALPRALNIEVIKVRKQSPLWVLLQVALVLKSGSGTSRSD